MKIDINQLRSLKSQVYDPSQQSLDNTYFDEYKQKDFSEQNLLELFHENTKLTEPVSFKLQPSAARFTSNPGLAYMQAQLEPDYAGHELIELPEPGSLDGDIGSVIESRRSSRDMAGEGISLQDLSTLLQNSGGVTGEKSITHDQDEDDDEAINQTFRAYASAGGLYPVENYVLVLHGGEDLEAGTYYYNPDKHALRVLERDPDLADKREELFALSKDIFDVSSASVVFALTGSFWRARGKYGPRGYRYILQESGHLAQNVLLAAEAMDLAAIPLAGFRDDPMNNHLGIDGVNEAILYTVAVGAHGDTNE